MHVDAWLPPHANRVYAVLDNLSTHRARDVLLFSLAFPRWEFVFQPVYAAYLNLIEPWWKTLRSLALKGKRFETWAEIEQAIAAATTYWNDIPTPTSGAVVAVTASPAVADRRPAKGCLDLPDAPLRAYPSRRVRRMRIGGGSLSRSSPCPRPTRRPFASAAPGARPMRSGRKRSIRTG